MTGKPYRSIAIDQTGADEAIACMTYVAGRLIVAPIDQAIADTLAFLGKYYGVDRAWVFEYDDELTQFRNTHEWSALGVTSHVEDLQDTPVTMIAWLHKGLLAGKAVLVDDVAALPVAAQALKRELLRQNNKSVLSAPMFHKDRLRACIGFDAVRQARIWTDDEVALLSGCARMIAAARYGRSGAPAKAAASTDPLVYIGHGGAIRGVTLNQIVGIRSRGDKSEAWLNDGTCVSDKRSLSVWRALLPAARFITIQRTAIANLIHIAGIDKHGGAGFHWQARMRGVDQDWPISKAHRKQVVERLGL